MFTLLEVVGAGASPDVSTGLGADEDSDQGGTDDKRSWTGREVAEVAGLILVEREVVMQTQGKAMFTPGR